MGSYFSKLYRGSGSVNLSRPATKTVGDSTDSNSSSNYQDGINNLNKDLAAESTEGLLNEKNAENNELKAGSLEESVNSSAAAWRDQIEVDPSLSLTHSQDVIEVELELSPINEEKVVSGAPENLEENNAVGNTETHRPVSEEEHKLTEVPINHQALIFSSSEATSDKLCDASQNRESIPECSEPEENEFVQQSTHVADLLSSSIKEDEENNKKTTTDELGSMHIHDMASSENPTEYCAASTKELAPEEFPTFDDEKPLESIHFKEDIDDLVLDKSPPVANGEVIEEMREKILNMNIQEDELPDSEKAHEISNLPVDTDMKVEEIEKMLVSDNESDKPNSDNEILGQSDPNMEQVEKERVHTDTELGVEVDDDKFVDSTNSDQKADHADVNEVSRTENVALEDELCNKAVLEDTLKKNENLDDMLRLSLSIEKDNAGGASGSVINLADGGVDKNETSQSERESEQKVSDENLEQSKEVDFQSKLIQENVDLKKCKECNVDRMDISEDQTPCIDDKGENFHLENVGAITRHE